MLKGTDFTFNGLPQFSVKPKAEAAVRQLVFRQDLQDKLDRTSSCKSCLSCQKSSEYHSVFEKLIAKRRCGLCAAGFAFSGLVFAELIHESRRYSRRMIDIQHFISPNFWNERHPLSIELWLSLKQFVSIEAF